MASVARVARSGTHADGKTLSKVREENDKSVSKTSVGSDNDIAQLALDMSVTNSGSSPGEIGVFPMSESQGDDDTASQMSLDDSPDNKSTQSAHERVEINNVLLIESIPYQDPETFRSSHHESLYPNGVKLDSLPKKYASQSVVDNFLKSIKKSNDEGLAFENMTDDYYLPCDLVNSLLEMKNLEKVPRRIQGMIATNKTTLAKEQYLKVCQNPEFVPIPSERSPGLHGNKDNGTQVKVCKNKSIRFSAVYYASLWGFVVSCVRFLMTPTTAIAYKNSGRGEVIGFMSRIVGVKRRNRWLVRCYKLLLSVPDNLHYRHVNLSDEECNSTHYKCSVAALIAATFHGSRPSTDHIVHHMGNRFNNNAEYLEWITQCENMIKQNRTEG